VTIFNKRNAAVGYLTLKALDRRHRRRNGLRLGLFVALGLISFGILAAVAAVHLRRRRGSAELLDESEPAAEQDDDAENEIVGEYMTAAPEPIPAT
jgi:hypothetical protein